jgi:hypothetical protein
MSTLTRLALVAPLALSLSTTAVASDTSDLPMGIASIPILSATPNIFITVENVSGSTKLEHRKLKVTSPDPPFSLSGQVFCKAILSGSTRLVESRVVFGDPVVLTGGSLGSELFEVNVWDATDPVTFQGNISSSNVAFQHDVDIPKTWNGGLFLGFNPSKVVEDELAMYASSGGSAADFLRQDHVFAVPISVNLVGACESTTSYGVHLWEGYTRRKITAHVFYKGDPDIEDPVTPIVTLPEHVTPKLPKGLSLGIATPPQAAVIVQLACFGDENDRCDDARDDECYDDRREGEACYDDDRHEHDDGLDEPGRFVAYETLPMLDWETGEFTDTWSGWVSHMAETCSEGVRTATTADGECVLVEGCWPEEFEDCYELDGCCEATPATR